MNSVFFYASFILFGTFISAISQVMLKKAAAKTYSSWIREYLNPLVIVAYIIFFAATFMSIMAYKGITLSMGPVLETTGYIYVTVFGVLVFHEKINVRKILALTLIICGICVYSMTG